MDTQKSEVESSKELRQYLNDFYADTAEVMKRVPRKKDEDGNVVDHIELPFGANSMSSEDYLVAKDALRDHLSLESITSPYASNDLVENFVELSTVFRTLDEMESGQLLKQELVKRPWSDSYWAVNKGMIAARYADRNFPNSMDWSKNFDYISNFTAASLIADHKSDILAPSEKYDYLMGDEANTLTQMSWEYVKVRGQVEFWAGICDGWAAASIFYDEPINKISVVGSNGQPIQFFPSDINALSSLLWAKGKYPINFIGRRCTARRPNRDDAGSGPCNDTNSGTWHMAIVNQLGQAKRPLIMDATYDAEIWNFPVWKYQYSYFNPQTLTAETSWRNAIVPYGRFTIDKFRKYRSPETKYVAGINMSVTYMMESVATHNTGHRALARTVQYVYDVELDANMKIIGGEWYSKIHPDFVWTPRVGARAVSGEDQSLGDPDQWTGAEPPPAAWARSAQAASRSLQPLAAVVDRLVQLSRSAAP